MMLKVPFFLINNGFLFLSRYYSELFVFHVFLFQMILVSKLHTNPFSTHHISRTVKLTVACLSLELKVC